MPKTPAQRAKEWRDKRWLEIEAMPKKLCACGCGELTYPINPEGKSVDYIKGHKQRGSKRSKPAWNKIGDEPLSRAEITKRYRERKLKEIEQMPRIPCACGCGTMIAPVGKLLRPVQYVLGHNPGGEETRFPKGLTPWNKDNPLAMGENHPGWKGGIGKTGYGFDFTHELKQLIKYRDKFTCQRCGVNQNDLHYYIHVHHLDADRLNNNPDNLVCSCAKCNTWAIKNPNEPFINPDIWARTHSE
jgi:hypothetical protein